ncbi:glycosyl transferase [Phaeodactylibacter luteus]|uniref:Glycosyl transferase n=1 Tax=Phaeodactylibacter luteus TaxID=1564516 RepID=A0A5C6S2P2_9BACT|nr:glycosyl transferase [Phaeodactylibacter luteus]
MQRYSGALRFFLYFWARKSNAIQLGININRYRKALYFLALALLAPALLINLGLLTLIDDEALRAWVALEMQLSDNYIAPMLHGDFYYKKPPVYNWMLLGVFSLTGEMDEWSIRIPTVAFLLVYISTIYYFARQHFSRDLAALSALAFLTCGRILFYDSFLGLIDISYSWLTFLSFMLFFHLSEKGRWAQAFGWSYALAAVGFLMKGLPAVVFQGATVLGWLAYRREWYRLFRWPHLLGGLIFLAITGAYYAAYVQYNSLDALAQVLLNESAKRTAGRYPFWFTVLHLLTYPFELLVYHFMPWGLLAVFLLKRGAWAKIWQHRFTAFAMLVFLLNIIVYWTAPKVHPRYVFMLIPLLFMVLLYLYNEYTEEATWQKQVIDMVLLGCCLVLPLAALAPLFLSRLSGTPWLWPKTLLIFALLSGLAYGAWRFREARLLTVAVALLAVRLAFNWFVLPDRDANDFGNDARLDAIRVARAYEGKDLRMFAQSEWQPMTSFQMTLERGAVIPVDYGPIDTSAYYVIDPQAYPSLEYETDGTLQMRHGKKVYRIVRFKAPIPKTAIPEPVEYD